MSGSKIEQLKQQVLSLSKCSENDYRDMRYCLDQIIDEATRKGKQCKKKNLGNPAVVGLAGFGITTLLFQFYNFGWMKPGPVLWVGIVYGGLSQFVAGFMEFAAGNNFGLSAFTTYGAFWMALAAMLIANDYTKYEAKDNELAMFLIGFTIYTGIMLIAASRHTTMLTVVFFFLFVGLVIMIIFHFYPTFHGLKIAGASVLFVCALSALYVWAHLVLLDSFKFDLLPVGRPVNRWFKSDGPPKLTCSGHITPIGEGHSHGKC